MNWAYLLSWPIPSQLFQHPGLCSLSYILRKKYWNFHVSNAFDIAMQTPAPVLATLVLTMYADCARLLQLVGFLCFTLVLLLWVFECIVDSNHERLTVFVRFPQPSRPSRTSCTIDYKSVLFLRFSVILQIADNLRLMAIVPLACYSSFYANRHVDKGPYIYMHAQTIAHCDHVLLILRHESRVLDLVVQVHALRCEFEA